MPGFPRVDLTRCGAGGGSVAAAVGPFFWSRALFLADRAVWGRWGVSRTRRPTLARRWYGGYGAVVGLRAPLDLTCAADG